MNNPKESIFAEQKIRMTKKIPKIPRWRSFLNSFRFTKYPIEVMNGNIAAHGDTFSVYIGGLMKGIVSTNPDFIQHVLQKNHRNYPKSPLHFKHLAHYLGNGLLTSDGEYWLRQRRLIQPGFHRKRLEILTVKMQEVIDEFIEQFDQKIKKEAEVDIYPLMLELAFKIVARSLFGTNLPEAQLPRLSHIITVLQEFIILLIRQPYRTPWFRITGKIKEMEALAAEADEIILQVIKDRRASGEKKDDLLQMLLDARYEDTGEGMTDRQLIDESAILFLAGHETTANALAWTWYLLGAHSSVAAKLKEEAISVCGDRTATFADLPNLKYCRQIIDESLRLYPPAWVTDRIAKEDDHINGIPIKAGTMIVTYIYGAHHAPEQWDDPEAFRPERFDTEKNKTRHPFAYLPFGGGPRLCIGNNFALMEMQLILTAMIRRYRFELVKGHPVEPQALITLRPKYGVRMRFFFD